MRALFKDMCRLAFSEDGPTATEYGVLIGVICVGVIAAMSAFGEHVNNIYVTLAGTIPVVP